MTTNARIALAALVAATAGWPATLTAQDRAAELSYGVTGSTPPEAARNPAALLANGDIQKLILDIAREPRGRAFVEGRMAATPFTVDDLVAVGLLRHDEGRFWIDFNLLLADDQRAILAASETLGRDLANALLARRDEFEALADRHDVPHRLRPELYYIVLGCFSLDWDGLDLTRERGYRAGAQRTIDGHEFTPWAKERDTTISLEGLFWGSHNSTATRYTFTTFGDHAALPRFGIPDLLWSTGGAFAAYEDLAEGRRAGRRLLSAYLAEALDDVATVMTALRDGEVSLTELARVTAIDPPQLEAIVQLLQVAEYIDGSADGFRSATLVLVPQDAPMVDAMMATSRDIMAAWHETNYPTLRTQLADLTPIRHGVPFERVYTEIWHFVFGIANRTLVERGFFADPYAPERSHQGFLPAIFANELVEGP